MLIEGPPGALPCAIEIDLFPPMLPSRPCRFCLSLQDGSVFADFDVDSDGRVFAVRVSFDGYGCCHAPESVGRMNAADSKAMLSMVQRDAVDASAASILRTYFQQNRDAFWRDALAYHGLLSEAFCERIFWEAAEVLAIGFEHTVELVDPDSGDLVRAISLGNDMFGHFGPADGDVLYVLGWRDVVAIERTFDVKWRSMNVAVDGITWRGRDADRIQLSAEMDPPGGWVDVELDADTGRRLPD